jgi:hypothetical protein
MPSKWAPVVLLYSTVSLSLVISEIVRACGTSAVKVDSESNLDKSSPTSESANY